LPIEPAPPEGFDEDMNELEPDRPQKRDDRPVPLSIESGAAGSASRLASALGRLHLADRAAGRALACFEESLRRGGAPDANAADRWVCRMLLGDFEGAWRESDAAAGRRARQSASAGAHRDAVHLWDGRPVAGRRVMIRCHHGLGDTIQFIRYVPRLAGICGWTGAEVQPVLFDLLRGLDGLDDLFTREDGRPRPGCDVEIECMELPRVFRTTLATIPSAVPYLRAPAALSGSVEAVLGGRDRFRIGLQWAAGDGNPGRSVPPSALDPLAAVPGSAFFRLPDGRGAVPAGPPSLRIAGTGDSRHDFPWTAAVIEAMDAIVTVDTMTAHLAGALAKPVFLLLAFRSDWRWLIGRDDCPWYPTMHLFRQPRPGDWSAAVARLAAALRILADA
jgi:hypothetical protein